MFGHNSSYDHDDEYYIILHMIIIVSVIATVIDRFRFWGLGFRFWVCLDASCIVFRDGKPPDFEIQSPRHQQQQALGPLRAWLALGFRVSGILCSS